MLNKKFLTPLFFFFTLLAYSQDLVNQTNHSATPGELKVTFTTVSYGGDRSPRNIYAVWVLNIAGKFVKTLALSASYEVGYLNYWYASTPEGNTVDAITGATEISHGERICTWNATSAASPETVMSDGTYSIKIQMTEQNHSGQIASFSFSKSPSPFVLLPSDLPGFQNLKLEWIPAPESSGVIFPSESDEYQIYPNPSKDKVFVNGDHVQEIQIFDSMGKIIGVSKETNFDMTAFPKGMYYVSIRYANGIQIRKFMKE